MWKSISKMVKFGFFAELLRDILVFEYRYIRAFVKVTPPNHSERNICSRSFQYERVLWLCVGGHSSREKRIGSAVSALRTAPAMQAQKSNPARDRPSVLLQHRIVLAVGNISVCAQTTADERAVAISDSPFVLVLKYKLGFVGELVCVLFEPSRTPVPTMRKQTNYCLQRINGKINCRDRRSTAVRSRSGSGSHLGFHSLPSRRFATSTPRISRKQIF